MTTKPYDTVFDPFMGSGTTMKVCESLKRQCIGTEIDKDYCDFINQRLQKQSPPTTAREE
jgi:DNA modification methylase